jgi:hypothetical protein
LQAAKAFYERAAPFAGFPAAGDADNSRPANVTITLATDFDPDGTNVEVVNHGR